MIIEKKIEKGNLVKTFFDTEKKEFVSRLTDNKKIEGRGDNLSHSIKNLEEAYKEEKTKIFSGDEAWEIYVEKFRNKEFRMEKKDYYTLEKHGHLYDTDKILRQIFKDNFKGDESEVMGLVLMLQGHDCLFDTDKMLMVLREHVERKDGLELLFNENETRFTNIVEEVFIRL